MGTATLVAKFGGQLEGAGTAEERDSYPRDPERGPLVLETSAFVRSAIPPEHDSLRYAIDLSIPAE